MPRESAPPAFLSSNQEALNQTYVTSREAWTPEMQAARAEWETSPQYAEQLAQSAARNGNCNGKAPLVLPFESAGDLLRRQLIQARYSFEPLIAAGCITVLGGYVGDGKTPFTVSLLKAMLAADAEFAGFPHGKALPDGYRIVYMTQESEYTFKPVLERFGLTPELVDGRMDIVYLSAALSTGATWPELVDAAWALVGDTGLLVVDPLADWVMVKDEDDNAQMTEAFRPIIKGVSGGRSALVSAHGWKNLRVVPDDSVGVNHIRGAGAVNSNASIVLVYKQSSEKNVGDARYLKIARQRFGDLVSDGRYLKLGDNGLELFEQSELERLLSGSTVDEDVEVCERALRDAGPMGIRPKELDDETGLGWRRRDTAMGLLAARGKAILIEGTRTKDDPKRYVHVLQTIEYRGAR